MCGISGIFAFSKLGIQNLSLVGNSIATLQRRGPDHHASLQSPPVALGHSRLSVLDPSADAHQPMEDADGNYILVFNGEFYNFREHRLRLEKQGVHFRSLGDTEVLLQLLIREGAACLEKVNGFFALAFYDRQKQELLLARDRYGIKPLHVYTDNDQLAFASELKALFPFGIRKELDMASLQLYLRLNYIPAPHSIYRGIEKVLPGTYWKIKAGKQIEKSCWYSIDPPPPPANQLTYEMAGKQLTRLVEYSVEKRLISDVPIGAFLSGGIDSSVITAIASKLQPGLNTFSMGYENEEYFDETAYAEKVANMYKTNHTTYRITKGDLLAELFDILSYLDEPFADSSALAVSILCKKTRQKATVALSGDGADEIFSGYHKHKATYFAAHRPYATALLKNSRFLWNQLPRSRNSKFSNLFRQLEKLSNGLALSPAERYWQWATFQQEAMVNSWLKESEDRGEYEARKNELLKAFGGSGGEIQQMLLTDTRMVLPDDMLTKVDRMSMMHGLEVRVPFLDHHIVDFAFSLPQSYKIDGKTTKKILRDAFRSYLPEAIYHRPKHGFEVPLLSWFRNELNSLIEEDLLSSRFIKEQGIFREEAIDLLKQQLRSNSPGDSASAVWNLLAFNYWWKNNLSS